MEPVRRRECAAVAIERVIRATTGAPPGILRSAPRCVGLGAALLSLLAALAIHAAETAPLPRGAAALCLTCETGRQYRLADGSWR